MTNSIKKNCEFCGTEFFVGVRKIVCSGDCGRKLYKKREFDKRFEANKLKYENADPNTYVTCGICGFKSSDISTHTKTHGIILEDYKKQYGNTKSQDVINKMVGSNNPAYNHGGKFSPFSKKFVKYETLTEEEKENIITDKFAENSRIMLENPQNSSTRIEYYLAQGMDEKEAQEALTKRQTTFSLKICIEKYGEEEGRKVWQERQDKWMNSLNAKTDEEKEEISRKKGTNFSYKDILESDIDTQGTLYLIKLSENQYKIGITTKTLSQRYSNDIYTDHEILYINDAEHIKHVFKVEQIIKHQYKNYVKKDDYGQFGWTEVFNDCDANKLYEDVNHYMNNKEITNSIYDSIY